MPRLITRNHLTRENEPVDATKLYHDDKENLEGNISIESDNLILDDKHLVDDEDLNDSDDGKSAESEFDIDVILSVEKNDESGKAPTVSQKDIVFVRKALLRTVESNGSNSDEKHNERIILVLPFLHLFSYSINSLKKDAVSLSYTTIQHNEKVKNGNIFVPIRPKFTLRSQRNIILHTIQNDFEKVHARILFSNLSRLLQPILENQDFIVPDDDEVDHVNSHRHDDVSAAENVQRECEHSVTSLHFLLWVAQCIQAYLNGLVIKMNEKLNSNRFKQRCLSVPMEVYELAFSLHNTLFELSKNIDVSKFDDESKTTVQLSFSVQNKILSLCETWWIHNGIQRENLIVNVLPLRVQAALNGKNLSRKSTSSRKRTANTGNLKSTQIRAIKRLYQIRKAVNEIDFEDPASSEFCSLLLQLVSLPEMLNLVEGKRFLSYLLQADATLMKKIHQCIRVQIPSNRSVILDKYGEIYFDAWKSLSLDENVDCDDDSSDEEDVDDSSSTNHRLNRNMRSEYESHVVQDLMYTLIHVSNSSTGKSLSRVLRPFHDAKLAKGNPEIERLLYDMYNPIIWRSLSATNALVRLNAIRVLGAIFPLQHPGHLLPEQSILKGCHAIQSALHDRDYRVRIVASESVAAILSNYWEVIPSSEIQALLNSLMEHVSDTSSAEVRVGALRAFTVLVETAATRAVLRPLLPKLGNLIHDKVEKVRSTCVAMLLRIKKIPGIKYYHVVPVDHITARLAAEGQRNPTNSVASLITRLMFNSYLPPNVEGNEQINRTVKFLTADPAAAKVFYRNVHQSLTVNEVGKLAAMLLRHLHGSVEVANEKNLNTKNEKCARGPKRHRQTTKPGADKSDDSITMHPTQAAVVAEIIYVLLESIEKDIYGNQECKDFLRKEFSGPAITSILLYYEAQASRMLTHDSHDSSDSLKDDCFRTCTAILRCAGRLPLQTVHGLTSHIKSAIQAVGKNKNDSLHPLREIKNLSAYFALLCIWGLTDEVALSISASIESAFETDHELLFASPCSDSKKRKSGRKAKDIMSEDKNTNDQTLGKIPKLSPSISLEVLGEILSGSDPSNASARESIMLSNDARHSIENALERGIRHAEKLLAADNVYTQSIRESEVKFIIAACECFGRFNLHKEASVSGGLEFGIQIEQLLQWTSAKVVPALSNNGRLPNQSLPEVFLDLNISSIAVEQSFCFVGHSPVVTGPPRRRTNLSRTPVRASDDGILAVESSRQDRPNEAARHISGSLAIALMHSSCVVFAEWLAVGGSGSIAIGKAAVEWTRVFDSTETDENIEAELLPAFSRLAVQLFRYGSDLSLFKEILIKCRIDDVDSVVIKNSITSLLASRQSHKDSSGLSLVLDCILAAAQDIWSNSQHNRKDVLPENFVDLLDLKSKNLCICFAFEAVLDNRLSMIELCKAAVQHAKSGIETEDIDAVIFHSKCLLILISNFKDDTKTKNEIKQLIIELDLDAILNRSAIAEMQSSLAEAGKLLNVMKSLIATPS